MKQKEKKYLAIGCGLLLVGCLLCGLIYGGR